MKKIFYLILCSALMLSAVACGGNSGNPPAAEKPGDTMSLEEIFTDILDEAELPASGNYAVTDQNFESFLFIPPVEGSEALASEALMSAIAHSAVLLRVPENADANAIAADIKANADPLKWICVSAEKTIVTVHNNTILLVMSSAAAADAITAKFDALWA